MEASPSILLLSSQYDFTSDLVALELGRRGLSFFRLNTERLFLDQPATVSLSYGSQPTITLRWKNEVVTLDCVRSVWYRRPAIGDTDQGVRAEWAKLTRRERGRFLKSLYSALPGFWVSPPMAIERAEDKLLQAAVAQDAGFRVPRTVITSDPFDARAFIQAVGGSCVAKTLSGGYVGVATEGLFIYSQEITVDAVERSRSLPSCPLMLQERIPRKVDIRAVIIGSKVFPIALKLSPAYSRILDWRECAGSEMTYELLSASPSMVAKCTRLTSAFNLRFASADLIVTPQDELVFLDLNPNGQWAWFGENITKVLVDEMCKLLASALRS